MINNTEILDKIKSSTFLVTGGAGFIGSNIVEFLLINGAKKVRVLDNLSTGKIENIKDYLSLENFEFIEGDIQNIETCKEVVEDIDYISHQAALGSVPRSIENPLRTNQVNITGFLNMIVAAKESVTLKKFVYAASSSTYGDSQALPKIEGVEGKPLSPYAITKAVNEMYADVFSNVYGFHSIGLRYFNVFGPKQDPNGQYAAVIPIFCKQIIEGDRPIINGDGETSRDFTYVTNAVAANICSMIKGVTINNHEVFNVACGEQISLNFLVSEINKLANKKLLPIYRSERKGDVKHSLASIDKIKRMLGYEPVTFFQDGISKVFNWYLNKNSQSYE